MNLDMFYGDKTRVVDYRNKHKLTILFITVINVVF
jgi:hypothetical protein